jgi:glycosyltransferase involved in cell wall biosynthesis
VLRSRFSQRDVVLCHDIGPVSHPELYDAETCRLYAAAYARIRAVAPGMVFVSQASQRAFEARFGTGLRFSRVIPLFVREGARDGAERSVPGVRAPFLLTVGALERRKNQVAAIRAFAASGLHAEGFTYVLCGARGSGGGEALALAARTPGVTVLGYVDDAQLRYLYQRASAFVLPSLLEGFGMPALEAAQYGLIPILSRDSALSEAVGGVCVATHADDVVELAEAMREVAGLDEDKRAGMRSALIRQAALASRARFLGAWETLIHDEGRLASTSAPPAYLERFDERSG